MSVFKSRYCVESLTLTSRHVFSVLISSILITHIKILSPLFIHVFCWCVIQLPEFSILKEYIVRTHDREDKSPGTMEDTLLDNV